MCGDKEQIHPQAIRRQIDASAHDWVSFVCSVEFKEYGNEAQRARQFFLSRSEQGRHYARAKGALAPPIGKLAPIREFSVPNTFESVIVHINL